MGGQAFARICETHGSDTQYIILIRSPDSIAIITYRLFALYQLVYLICTHKMVPSTRREVHFVGSSALLTNYFPYIMQSCLALHLPAPALNIHCCFMLFCCIFHRPLHPSQYSEYTNRPTVPIQRATGQGPGSDPGTLGCELIGIL